MKNIRKLLIPLLLLCLTACTAAPDKKQEASEETTASDKTTVQETSKTPEASNLPENTKAREDPTLGLRYVLTDEMTSDGITLMTNGLSAVNDVGEMDIVQNNEILEVILVMEPGTFENFNPGQNAEEYYKSAYPEFDITSAKQGDHMYLYLDFSPTLDPSDSALEKACSLSRDFVSSLEYIPVAAEKISVDSVSFTTVNLDGEEVTDAVFAGKDITILNVWATYCNPCINEMPDLASWEQELPENVQLLYLCTDLSTTNDTNRTLAETITEKSGINRKNVILFDQSFSELIPLLSAVPTTLFFDKDGNLSDKIVVGAKLEQYKAVLRELLGE